MGKQDLWKWGVLFVLSLGIALSFVITRPPIYITSDANFYYFGAKSLLEGKGYRQPQFQFKENPNETLPQVMWPPGYSVLLAGLMKWGDYHFLDAVRLINEVAWICFLCCMALLVYFLFQSYMRTVLALILLIIYGPFYSFINAAATETLFLAQLSCLALSVFYYLKNETIASRKWLPFFIGIQMALSFLTRYAAFSIILGTAAFFFFFFTTTKWTLHKMKHFLLIIFPPLATILAWSLQDNFGRPQGAFQSLPAFSQLGSAFFDIINSFGRNCLMVPIRMQNWAGLIFI